MRARRRAAFTVAALLLTVVAATSLAVPHAAGAAGLSARWRPLPPNIDGRAVNRPRGLAGRVTATVAVPGNPATQIVGTHGGIWRKTGSRRWVDVTSRRWPSAAVNSLAVDPTNPRVLYAGTGYDVIDDINGQPGAGVLKSVDGGRTWRSLAATRAPMRGYAVTGLAVDPLDPRIVVAAANNGLFRTTDAGATWSEVKPIPPGPYGVAEVRLAVDAKTGVMLAGVAQSGGIDAKLGAGSIATDHAILRSTDAGATWNAYAVDASTSDDGMVVAPAIASGGGHTYAYALDITSGDESGLYTSADGGRAWTRQVTVDAKFSIAQIVADPLDPTRAYFGIIFGPYEYEWGASAFEEITGQDGSRPQFGDFRALAIGPAGDSGRALYGGTDGGSTVYDLGTRTFTNNSAGLVAGIDYSGAARTAGVEASGAQDLGVDVYAHKRVREVFDADAYGVMIDRKHPSTYYASMLNAAYASTYVVSHDAGAHWSPVDLPAPVFDPSFMKPVQASGAPDVLVLPQRFGSMFVSADDGRSWHERPSPDPGSDLIAVTAAAPYGSALPEIHAGSGAGRLWRSRDLRRELAAGRDPRLGRSGRARRRGRPPAVRQRERRAPLRRARRGRAAAVCDEVAGRRGTSVERRRRALEGHQRRPLRDDRHVAVAARRCAGGGHERRRLPARRRPLEARRPRLSAHEGHGPVRERRRPRAVRDDLRTRDARVAASGRAARREDSRVAAHAAHRPRESSAHRGHLAPRRLQAGGVGAHGRAADDPLAHVKARAGGGRAPDVCACRPRTDEGRADRARPAAPAAYAPPPEAHRGGYVRPIGPPGRARLAPVGAEAGEAAVGATGIEPVTSGLKGRRPNR
jgi:photosystem II stability/assembly factor-like uncharacterized protein